MVQHIFSGFHFLAIALMLTAVVCQITVAQPVLTLAQLGRLLKLDTLYSWAALIAVISGFSLWLLAPGMPGNLLQRPTFCAKLVLFIVVAGLSVYPSMVFLRLRDGELKPRMLLRPRVQFVIALEILLLLLIAGLGLCKA